MLAIGLALFSLSSATRVFMPQRPVSPYTPTTAARSQVPMMPLFDFGTGNFDAPPGKKKSFFIGVERAEGERQPNKFSTEGEDVVNVNPLYVLLAFAPIGVLTAAVASFIAVTPGQRPPFSFLDAYYPPRVAEMKQIEAKRAELDKIRLAAEAKAKAEAEAKAKADAEAAAKAAAEEAKGKAPAAKK
jgi:hypothetical protein